MLEIEHARSSSLHAHGSPFRPRQKTSFQQELEGKISDRKARGLAPHDSVSEDSDDDGLGSDDDMLALFNATSRSARNRPGSAKRRGNPLTSVSTESQSPTKSSPGLTAEEILKQRETSTPSPKTRKATSEKPLTKEDIIFGGKSTSKDAHDLPLHHSSEKKLWQPPSFLTSSDLKFDEPKASPRLSTKSALDDFEKKLLSKKSSDHGGRDSPSGHGHKRDDRESPSDMRTKRTSSSKEHKEKSSKEKELGRKSPLNEKESSSQRKSLSKQETIHEAPSSHRFLKSKGKDHDAVTDKKSSAPKPEPRSRGSSASSSEIFKRRGTASYLIDEKSDSDDSAEDFLRKVKGHEVTGPKFSFSGRGTPDRDGSRSPQKEGRKIPVEDHKSPVQGRKSPLDKGRKTPVDGRKSPLDKGRITPVEGRKSPLDKGRITPVEGRKSTIDAQKSPLPKDRKSTQKDVLGSPKKDSKYKKEDKDSKRKKEDDDEDKEDRRKSVFDHLVGEKDGKEGSKTPSPASRRRATSSSPSEERGRSPISPLHRKFRSPSPKLDKPKPKERDKSKQTTIELRDDHKSLPRDDHKSLLGDDHKSLPRDEVDGRKSRRTGSPEPESSICGDVEKDPMMALAAERKKLWKSKNSKQTSEHQAADDVIEHVADLNEESRTMKYIQSDGEEKKLVEDKPKKSPKKEMEIVRPKPRYAKPQISETRPESARTYSSASEIRESIYHDWYLEKMKRAKEELRKKEAEKKLAKEKEEKAKLDKVNENKMAFESWHKSKDNWMKEKVKSKHTKEKDEEKTKKEKLEKEKVAEMTFKTWKESKNETIADQAKKKKKEEERKRRDEEEKKKERKVKSVELFVSWKSKKDNILVSTYKGKKMTEKEHKEQQQQERIRKEKEAQASYERWLENSEHRQRRQSLRLSQSMEDLKQRPPWSPAKTLIGTKNCRV